METGYKHCAAPNSVQINTKYSKTHLYFMVNTYSTWFYKINQNPNRSGKAIDICYKLIAIFLPQNEWFVGV